MNEYFVKYRAKIIRESVFKSIFSGAVFGLLAWLISALLFWFFGIKVPYLPPIIFVVVTALSAVLFYLGKYKVDETYIARRLDALGLEERMITMAEFKNQNSYIAVRQREDAQQALGKIDEKQIMFKLKKSLIITLSIVGVVALAAWSVQILSTAGVVKSGVEIYEDIKRGPIPAYTVEYDVQGEGYIDGDLAQVVDEGESTDLVMAVPDDGWVFVCWSDGVKSDFRQEFNVVRDMEIYAIFEEAADQGDDFLPGEDGLDLENADGMPMKGNQPGNKPSDDPGPGSGGQYEEINQVYDGETYYGGAVYENAYEEAKKEMESNDNYDGDIRDIISEYFKSIAK